MAPFLYFHGEKKGHKLSRMKETEIFREHKLSRIQTFQSSSLMTLSLSLSPTFFDVAVENSMSSFGE